MSGPGVDSNSQVVFLRLANPIAAKPIPKRARELGSGTEDAERGHIDQVEAAEPLTEKSGG